MDAAFIYCVAMSQFYATFDSVQCRNKPLFPLSINLLIMFLIDCLVYEMSESRVDLLSKISTTEENCDFSESINYQNCYWLILAIILTLVKDTVFCCYARYARDQCTFHFILTGNEKRHFLTFWRDLSFHSEPVQGQGLWG